MDENAKFTFINGPTVKSISSKDDRSSVRSWFLRRTFEDRRKAALNAKSGRKRNLLPSSCKKQRRSPKKEILDEEDSKSINELISKHAIIASEDSAAQVLAETSGVSTDGIESPKSQLLFLGNQRSDPFAPKYIPDMDNNYDRHACTLAGLSASGQLRCAILSNLGPSVLAISSLTKLDPLLRIQSYIDVDQQGLVPERRATAIPRAGPGVTQDDDNK
ncbi:hypothetical protein TrVFT333_002257 [Trichoderma virens FT-333]|nr:hypothetical protein TrVFT333_002257 [Trichoderma virens FT-333]